MAPLLRPGDRVVVVAASSPVRRGDLDRGIAWLRGRGLVVEEGRGLDAVRGDLAGADADRAAALEEAAGRRPAAVWFARGGYGAARLLPLLDLDRLAASGAVFAGFSDSTALLVPLARAGGRCLHAPLVETLGRGVDPATERALDDLVFGSGRHEVEIAGAVDDQADEIDGPIVAGNLAVLASLCGTPWSPSARGAVAFLEDTREATYRVDRALTQLLQAGFFDGARGIVLGAFPGCAPSPADGPASTLEEVFRDLAERSGLPCRTGFPFGHGPATGVLPLGGRVRIAGARAVIELDGPRRRA